MNREISNWLKTGKVERAIYIVSDDTVDLITMRGGVEKYLGLYHIVLDSCTTVQVKINFITVLFTQC